MIRLAFLIQTTKNSSTTWHFLILNQSWWKTKVATIQKQGHGLGRKFQFRKSISSDLIQEPIFLCDPIPRDLVSSFIKALQHLAKQSKSQMKTNFLQIETNKKTRLSRSVEVQNHRRSHPVGIEAENDNFENSSTKFLPMQENQLLDLHTVFAGNCKTLPVFRFDESTR